MCQNLFNYVVEELPPSPLLELISVQRDDMLYQEATIKRGVIEFHKHFPNDD